LEESKYSNILKLKIMPTVGKRVFPYNAVGRAQADSYARMTKGKIKYNPTYGMENSTKSSKPKMKKY
tara:strand:- start:283 stop:483 length:201 start_codon:yes stop_codon:yes gene_type:complete